MRYLVFDALSKAKVINHKIHQYMIDNVSDYNAIQWSKITTNNDGTKFSISVKETDKRSPDNALSIVEKTKLVNLDNTWYVDGTLNFVSED